jgi:hypothetical protein
LALTLDLNSPHDDIILHVNALFAFVFLVLFLALNAVKVDVVEEVIFLG